MPPYTPNTNLWLERSRLAGMILAAVTYGIFFLLTIQTNAVLIRRPRQDSQTTRHRWMLLGYVWITFSLATIGFAGNARYTEMIWIDLRSTPGGPAVLILGEMNYPVNMMASTCYYIMEWFMQALLLYRCFVLWDWKKSVVILMCTTFVVMVGLSTLVLAEARHGVHSINNQLGYLFLQVGLTLAYTLLVVRRLLALQRKMRAISRREDLSPHENAVVTIIESAALYAPVGVIVVISFAMHSDVTNLVYLSVSHVQGIAQLFIIIRIAKDEKSVLSF